MGHPNGLYVLFFVEMWERFSYNGMRALLIFYLTKQWLYSDQKSALIYGGYSALVYITPVVGGYLADRFIGQRRAVLYGASLLSIGHLLMAFGGDSGQDDRVSNLFWLGLGFIIVGSGFIKANIAVMVGFLYPRVDRRRDSAYTLFFIGINLGSFLGALIAGYVGETLGWSYGFGIAGLGMLLGLATLILGKSTLNDCGGPPCPERLARRIAGLRVDWLIYAGAVPAVVAAWWLLQREAYIGYLLGVTGIVLILHVLLTAALRLNATERNRIVASLLLLIVSILFWVLFEQAGSSLNLLTDRFVDRSVGGWEVPATAFQSLNPLYILALGPFAVLLWPWLARRGWEPSTPVKFGLALIQLGLSFLILVWGSHAAGMGNEIPVMLILTLYLLQTTAELCISPTGLSAVTQLSPPQMASLMTGTWFFASAAGSFVAGMFAAAAIGSGATADKASLIGIYELGGWAAVAAGFVALMAAPLIVRLMQLHSLEREQEEASAQAANRGRGDGGEAADQR